MNIQNIASGNFLPVKSFFESDFETLADATLLDKMLYGFKITLVGMALILLVLIFMWVVLKLIGVNLKVVSKNAAEQNATENTMIENPITETVNSTQACNEETVVAIATAAIAAMRGQSECAFNVISVNRIN